MIGIVHVLNNKHQIVIASLFVNNAQPIEPTILNIPPMNTDLEERVMTVYHYSTGTQYRQITSGNSNISSKTSTTYKTTSSLESKPLATHTQGSSNIMSSTDAPDLMRNTISVQINESRAKHLQVT